MKKIIVAPLNWGLGHATRCIPIIQGLLDNGYEPVIASDGVALELLKKNFLNLLLLNYHHMIFNMQKRARILSGK